MSWLNRVTMGPVSMSVGSLPSGSGPQLTGRRVGKASPSACGAADWMRPSVRGRPYPRRSLGVPGGVPQPFPGPNGCIAGGLGLCATDSGGGG